MATHVDEFDDGIFRICTSVPGGTTVNQFLIDADEPLLFHAGPRRLFEDVTAAVASVMPLERLRWLSFSHIEADEMGAMNGWLAAVPRLQVIHSPFACSISIDDLADRQPRRLAPGDTLELGGRTVQMIATPHLPHNGEAMMLLETVTGTLLCSDLGSNRIDRVLSDELVLGIDDGPSPYPGVTALTPSAPTMLRALAAFEPTTLAVMHGAAFRGDASALLHSFAKSCEALLGAGVLASQA
ncbi:MAG: MBL fold metallo-hydrolase [Actinomycetota bacterium]|nr:MBL fold metallo-hydrolase [Actinomycetota bacterium]